MIKYILLYLVTLAAFFVIDMIWLGLIAKGFYRKQLGFIMAEKINWAAAILFYLLFITGLVFFVVNPALRQDSALYAFLTGAFFGMICYATYDLSNLATLKNWPPIVTLVDIVWGSSLAGILSVIGFFFGKSIF